MKLFLTLVTTIIIGLLSSSSVLAAADDSDPPGCCTLTKRPGSFLEHWGCLFVAKANLARCIKEQVGTARWMAQSLEWGTLSTFRADPTNTDANGDDDVSSGDVSPFGNTYSFADGPCGAGSGTPYFYGSNLDASFTDAAKNPSVSFTLTEASLKSSCANRHEDLSACAISAKGGDPENPPCARVTLVGNFTLVTEGTDEYTYGKAALFERHPAMATWPTDHDWLVGKIDVEYVWTIDFYGGANVFTAEQYYGSDGNRFKTDLRASADKPEIEAEL